MNSSKVVAYAQPDYHKSYNAPDSLLKSVSSGTVFIGQKEKPRLPVRSLQIAIVDDRSLMRDCFGRNLALLEPSLGFKSYSSIDDFIDADAQCFERTRVVVLCVNWSKPQSDEHFANIARLKAANPELEIVLLSDIEEPGDVLRAIGTGARGNIPTSVSLEVAIKAMQLVAAGGIYIPEHLLVWLERNFRDKEKHATARHRTDEVFTPRQMAVIDALRRGKPNKIIAYELNMCESTVKVHIRTIMKKLKARNRTEVAFKLNDMVFQASPQDEPLRH